MFDIWGVLMVDFNRCDVVMVLIVGHVLGFVVFVVDDSDQNWLAWGVWGEVLEAFVDVGATVVVYADFGEHFNRKIGVGTEGDRSDFLGDSDYAIVTMLEDFFLDRKAYVNDDIGCWWHLHCPNA